MLAIYIILIMLLIFFIVLAYMEKGKTRIFELTLYTYVQNIHIRYMKITN